jgi:hypothetical protein
LYVIELRAAGDLAAHDDDVAFRVSLAGDPAMFVLRTASEMVSQTLSG